MQTTAVVIELFTQELHTQPCLMGMCITQHGISERQRGCKQAHQSTPEILSHVCDCVVLQGCFVKPSKLAELQMEAAAIGDYYDPSSPMISGGSSDSTSS